MLFIGHAYFALLFTVFSLPVFGKEFPMNNARLLLGMLRGGDYAHPGDKEAVDTVAEKVLTLSPEIQDGPVLDVGSGFGGTANRLRELNFKSIFGIDLDEAAVEYAKEHYPEVNFLHANANDVLHFFDEEFFSFIYMFNVLYAIEDKKGLLERLFKVAKPGALLVIFDYTTKQKPFSLQDLAGKPMYPFVMSELEESLKETGWEVKESVDLSPYFLKSYEMLLSKLKKESEALSVQFSQESVTKVETTFNFIYESLKSSALGGAAIYAKKPA